MTGQKERACPCANTDKLKENMNNFLPPEYSTDLDQLQYAGILYYAVDGHGHKFQASTVLRLSDPQLGELAGCATRLIQTRCPYECPTGCTTTSRAAIRRLPCIIWRCC